MATIYTLQNPSPRNEVRDMSVNQTFSGIVDGVRYTDYQLFIYRVSDNVLIYNSTKLALSPNLPDGATWQHVVPSGSVANSSTATYKWKLQVWNGAETVTSREFAFSAKASPVLTFNPPAIITTQSYNFTATLTQAQGDIPNTYTFELYDSSSTLIDSSGLITNFNIAYEFTGMISGQTFKVKVFGDTTGGQKFDSGLIEFLVDYTMPDLDVVPVATVDNLKGTALIRRGDIVQIIGVGTGGISYDADFPVVGMTGLTIGDSSSYVNFDVSIPVQQNLWFDWMPDVGFSGRIIELDNGVYEVGYYNNRFYYIINGVRVDEAPTSIAGKYFLINLTPTKVYFIEKTL